MRLDKACRHPKPLRYEDPLTYHIVQMNEVVCSMTHPAKKL